MGDAQVDEAVVEFPAWYTELVEHVHGGNGPISWRKSRFTTVPLPPKDVGGRADDWRRCSSWGVYCVLLQRQQLMYWRLISTSTHQSGIIDVAMLVVAVGGLKTAV
uniref:Uncharacterized protein n=1 Tax=Nelumbo nucifera TaxID=4432 RepID=A0A822XUJ1_NELNU|nr:TPA_asm: hypothetical protein HUJ06_023938 [Nelumbo nucifera]